MGTLSAADPADDVQFWENGSILGETGRL